MTAKDFSDAMGQIDERYIMEALNYTKGAPARARRRLTLALIAAVMALLLLGAGVAAVIYGDSIQNWFEYQWERMTDQAMSQGHNAVIDHLSQEIGVSQTVGETTVTVDSATVGDDIIYLLLRVEGPSLNRRHTYNFDGFHMAADPDPLEDGMGAIGFRFYGMDGDGAALFLMEFEYGSGSRNGFVPDTRPMEVLVELEDLLRTGYRSKVLEEGGWRLTFTLDRGKLPEAIVLPDTEVTAVNMDGELETVLYTDIELTSTGIRFRHDLASRSDPHRLVEAPEHIKEMTGQSMVSQMYVVLENGGILEIGSGTGIAMHDIGKMSCSYHWTIPIDLDEVAAIQIGQTQIPVP